MTIIQKTVQEIGCGTFTPTTARWTTASRTPTGTNQGQAVGSSGWYYNNVRNNGVVGIQ